MRTPKGVNLLRIVSLASFTALLFVAVSLPAVAPPSIKEITIMEGAFFFQGPDGTSSSTTNPAVVAILKNGEPVKLTFQNVSSIDHEIISPLFSAPTEKVRILPHGKKLTIMITPKFRSVEDGAEFVFDLACHEMHGTPYDHFLQGMHALIKVKR